MMKKWAALWMSVCLLLTCAACGATGEEAAGLIEVEYKKADLKAEWKADKAVSIIFDGRLAEISGGGAYQDGNVLVINSKGDYLLSGEFSGRIVVDADKDDKVRLILDLMKEYGE